MTNSEAIEILYDSLGGRKDLFEDAFKIAISALEENDKLKAEIDRLSSDNAWLVLNKSEKEFENVDLLEHNDKLKAEIEQLKSELEQSVIQCTHGYDKRQNEIGETLIFCEYTDNWMNVTLGNCLGNCEEEQHLKGKVSE